MYILGGGSDFCRGVATVAPIPNCGIVTLLKWRAQLPAVMVQDAPGGCESTGAFESILLRTRSRRDVEELAPVISAAIWNISYWQTVLERNGLAPMQTALERNGLEPMQAALDDAVY